MASFGQAPELHLGPTRTQVLAQVAAQLFGFCVAYAITSSWRGYFRPYYLAPAVLGTLLAAATMWRFLLSQGLILDAEGLTSRRGLFTRRVQWIEVRAIEVRRGRAGAASLVVQLHKGRSVRPPYPSHRLLSPDRKFDQKAEAVLHWPPLFGRGDM